MGNGLGVPVKNEYRCIEYATERIEGVRVERFGEAEGGEGRLHPGACVAQQIKILHCASGVADLQLDTMACKYPCVVPRKVVIAGSWCPGSNCELMWWQRIDPAIGDVQDGKDNARREKQNQ